MMRCLGQVLGSGVVVLWSFGVELCVEFEGAVGHFLSVGFGEAAARRVMAWWLGKMPTEWVRRSDLAVCVIVDAGDVTGQRVYRSPHPCGTPAT